MGITTSATSPTHGPKGRVIAAAVLSGALLLGLGAVAAPSAQAAPGVPAGQPQAVAVQEPTPKQVERARARIAAELERLESNSAGTRSAAPVGGYLGKQFGSLLLQGLLKKGIDFGFDEILAAMGLGTGAQLGQSLRELHGSVAHLAEEVEAIHETVKELLDRSVQESYENSYRDSLEAADNIDLAFQMVTAWVDNDREEIDPALMADTLRLLSFVNNLASNTTDPTVGTIPKMMESVEYGSAVSDQVEYWRAIDEARDSYRASMAMGLAAYSLITERWDPTGTIRDTYEVQAGNVEHGVERMYGLGVAVQQPAGSQRHVNVQHSGELLAAVASPAMPGQDWEDLPGTRAALEPRLQAMDRGYRPSGNGAPATLAAYLDSRGLPTAFDFSDTYRLREHEGPVVCDGSGCVPLYYEYSVVSTEGYFDGNRYRTREVTRAPKKKDAREEMQKRRDELAQAAAAATVKRMPVTSNDAGRAVDVAPEATAAAAVGEVMSWNSALPVAEGRYIIDSPNSGPIAVSSSGTGTPRFPLFGTANSARDGEEFRIERVGVNEYVLQSQSRGYVGTSHATLHGGATKETAARFDIRTSGDGRTWIRHVSHSPQHFWVGQEDGNRIVFVGEGFGNGYAEDHYFTFDRVG